MNNFIFCTVIATFPGAINFIKKETLGQVFSWEFCEIFKNTCFYRTPLVAASVLWCFQEIFNGSIDQKWIKNVWKYVEGVVIKTIITYVITWLIEIDVALLTVLFCNFPLTDL